MAILASVSGHPRFEMGADDYVSKPFNPRVLLAHIRALLRRASTGIGSGTVTDGSLKVADLIIDPLARRVLVGTGSREIAMTSVKFDLFRCFVTRPQRVLSREQLLVWTRGRVADVFDRTFDVQVSRLRRRLEESGSASSGLLKTVRNAGYILSATAVPRPRVRLRDRPIPASSRPRASST